MMNNGVHVNGIEYPVVAENEARLRLNLMPQHTFENMDIFVQVFDKVYKEAVIVYHEALDAFYKRQELRILDEEKKEVAETVVAQQTSKDSKL